MMKSKKDKERQTTKIGRLGASKEFTYDISHIQL